MSDTVDGRVARGLRTRTAIVEAFLDLVTEGVERPRANQVAARAGVSVRTIYQHFSDLEALRADVVAVQSERLRPFLRPIEAHGDLRTRVEALATRRAELYEHIAPVRRAMERSGVTPVLDEGRRRLDRILRSQLEQLFEPELSALERPERTMVLAGLDALSSYAAWDHLRRSQRRSVLQAWRIVGESLIALLSR